MPKFKLLESTDTWITRPKLSAQREDHLYPSEASVVIKGEDGHEYVEGTCLRAAYLRHTGVEGSPPQPRSEYIFAQGKIIEEYLVEQWKQMGLWITNSLKFYWPEYNISGELDCVLTDPTDNQPFGVEVKTFYGYDAGKQIIGNKWNPGFPKMSQLLQTIIYAYYFRDKLPYFKMVYFARDDVRRREFDISVIQEGDRWYPVIDGEVFRKFTVEDILSRYQELNICLKTKNMPPKDYELVWDSDRVEREKKNGNVSKTAYEEWKKGKRAIGDWQCSYCNYKNLCWGSEETSDTTVASESSSCTIRITSNQGTGMNPTALRIFRILLISFLYSVAKLLTIFANKLAFAV